jgi:regulator-associated protein of mTOR
MVLSQLPALIEQEEGKRHYDYQHSTFFAEQLTAFEVYLSSGPTEKNPPDQLPIVLQVLLSQAHRLRALILLSKFLDLGPWAVHLALSIGIFPYVVKLLQSAAQELKPVMVFIWARIMAVDHTVQNDLLKDNGIHYFITILSPSSPIPVGNASEHRAMCAFIVAIFCKDYPQGQNVCLAPALFEACLTHLMDVENPLLRQWSCLCLSMLWLDFPEAKWMGIRCSAPPRLCELSLDPVPEVRAAMLHALTSFIGIPDLTDQVAQIEESLAMAVMPMGSDGSVLVRRELLVFFSTFVKRYQNKFLVAAYEELLEERHFLRDQLSEGHLSSFVPEDCVSHNTIFGSIWKLLLILSVDPHPDVARDGGIIVDHTHKALLESPMGGMTRKVRAEILELYCRLQSQKPQTPEPIETRKTRLEAPPVQAGPKSEGYFSMSIRRTASVAASLKNRAFGSPAPSEQRPSSSSVSHPTKPSPMKNRVPITPRGRAPPEWTRPPEVNDQVAAPGSYRQAPTPSSRGFRPRDLKVPATIPLRSKFLDWSTEVISIFFSRGRFHNTNTTSRFPVFPRASNEAQRTGRTWKCRLQ